MNTGSTNEFPLVVVAAPWEVARGGKLLCVRGRGSRHVCWAYSITIVVFHPMVRLKTFLVVCSLFLCVRNGTFLVFLVKRRQ